VTGKNNVPYRGRKSTTTQNVLCMVDFDLYFTYVYAGWEGSTHDSRVFGSVSMILKFASPRQLKVLIRNVCILHFYVIHKFCVSLLLVPTLT
jgi:hypothetical protein